EERDREQDVEQSQHRGCQQHAQRQPSVATVSLAFHRESAPLKARMFQLIVALGVGLTAAAAPVSAAPSERVAVIVVPASASVFRSPRAAHGLLVVGEGATVSRRGALASLMRGEMGNAIVD